MKQKKWFVKVLLSLFVTALLCGNGYSYICGNGAGGGYGEDENVASRGTKAGICSQNNQIEYYIVMGAGYYLKSKTSIQQLLKAVEWQDLQGVNFYEMENLVNSALYHMGTARYVYDILISQAEQTPYNESVLALLRDFDYDGFVTEKNLNRELFDVVRGYLQSGDITGVFKYSYKNQTKIISLLKTIKTHVYNRELPDISIFWDLNEILDQNSIVGSYVARVFYEIR
jgi:hypothetical protein